MRWIFFFFEKTLIVKVEIYISVYLVQRYFQWLLEEEKRNKDIELYG